MITDHGAGLLAIGVGNDQVGRLHRHMAVDAGYGDFVAQLWEFTASFHVVTFQTMSGKGGGGALRLMHVVTGRTSHLGRGKITAAHLQKSYLIAMNIGSRGRGGLIALVELVERLTGKIGERSSERKAATAMTLSTKINLLLAG